jgi:lipopolysaccharide export system permease protein
VLSTVDRWLAGRFLRAYLVFLGASLALFVVIDALSNVERLGDRAEHFAQAGATWGLGQALVQRYGSMVPELFFLLSPHFVLLAGLWTITSLIRGGELVPLFAAGYAPRRIAAPLLVSAALLGTLSWADRELLLPAVAHLRRSRDMRGLESPRSIPDGAGGVLSARHYRMASEALVQASFVRLDARAGEVGTVLAQEAFYDGAAAGWRFVRGVRIEPGEDGLDRVTAFGPEGYLVPSRIQPRDVEASIQAPIDLSSDQLRAQLERTPGFRHLEVLLYERYTQAAAGVALLLTALPLVLGGAHGGLYGRVLLGIGLGVAYFLLTTVLFEVANRGAIEPAAAALVPPCLFGAAGLGVFTLGANV